MIYQISYYFFLFFIYSFLGWIVETINCSILEKKKVLNRGFLIGPYLPIYGSAALIMILCLTEYKHDPFTLFCMAVVYASLLEYATSFLMEKLFHARWWNYTHEKLNLNGRICLKNSLLFGVLGFTVIYYINPAICFLLDKIPNSIMIILVIILSTIFILDVLITLWILSKLNIQIKNIKSDATEEIDREAKKLLSHYRLLYKRLINAFPKINFTIEPGNILMDRIRKQFGEIDEFLTKKKKDIVRVKQKIKRLRQDMASVEQIQNQKQLLKEIRRRKFK